LIKALNPQSVIDVGCGIGTFLNVFEKAGITDIMGLDGKWVDREKLSKNISLEKFQEIDLEKEISLDRKYDMAICLEVLEHVKNSFADVAVKSLTKLSDIIVFSAAIPGQGGQNHINEQWFEYWEIKFKKYNYSFHDVFRPIFWNNPNLAWWYKQNMFLVVNDLASIDHSAFEELWDKNIKNYVHPDLFSSISHQKNTLNYSISSIKTRLNMTPLISVVIPVYNGEKTLVETLTSVIKQTYTYFEVIIVDDGSDNPVESFISQFIKDDRIKVYRTERSNANIARNYGISESKGEYIAMLDADDYWLENHLNDCLVLLQESGAEGLYGSLFLRSSLSGDIHNLPVFYAYEPKEGESMIDYLLTTGYGAQTSTLFTTSRSMKDIMWNPELIDHQDYDFVVRFCKKHRMTVKKEPTVAYFLSSGRAIHYITSIKFVEDNIKDIAPEIYMRYNLNMYLRAGQKEYSKKFVPYFRKETTRYKEYLSYQHYISIRDPQNRISEWIDKIKYIFYILRIKTEI